MKKIYVTVESSQGRVLGRCESSKERITIGRAPTSLIRIDDDKVSSLECEIYLLNDECWLQVSKEGSAVSFKGKQFRTLKIEESSVLYFRHLVLKVDFTKPQEVDTEKTRVLSGLELAPPIKKEETPLSTGLEMTKVVLEPTSADLDISEKTRVVTTDMEHTRVVQADAEATRIVSTDTEKTRVVAYSAKVDHAPDKELSTSITEDDIYAVDEAKTPFNIKDYLESNNINFKELSLIALSIVVTIGVGKWLFFSSSKETVNLDLVAQEQQKKLMIADPQRSLAPSLNPPQAPIAPSETAPATREEYLRSLSSLFDKH